MSLWDRLLRSRRVTREVRDELRAHLDERVDDLVDAGVPEADAYRRARIELGNAARAIEDSRGVWASRVLDQLGRDLRWTWRGVRARRGRAVLSVALLAIALAANTIVFAIADSLVFDRVPYPNAKRLVTIQEVGQGGRRHSLLSARSLEEWRRQTDVFAGVEGFFTGTTFIVGPAAAEHVDMASVTPGLMDVLGVRPKWGRALTSDDAAQLDVQSVLVSADLARRYFASPEHAVGQALETAARPLRIVGVMPPGFVFPSGRYEIWRAVDPRGPLARTFGYSMSSVALVQPGWSRARLDEAVAARGVAVAAAIGDHRQLVRHVDDLDIVQASAATARTFGVLLGAAMCLLLVAAVNVLGFELTTIVGKARTFAIQSALGASRAMLVRVAAFEGLCLVVASTLVALGLIGLGLTALDVLLPAWLRQSSANPIDFDTRTFACMAIAAAAVSTLVSLPAALYTSRRDLAAPLKLDVRTATSGQAGAVVRRLVTMAQVAIAVALVIVGSLYARTYAHLIAIGKGFDSTNLASLSASLPPSGVSALEVAQLVKERLGTLPAVLGTTVGPPPPSSGNSPFADVTIRADGRDDGTPIAIGATPIEPEYFNVLRVPLRAGRWFGPGEPEGNVLVSESFARRYWPHGEAVGHVFQAMRGAKPISSNVPSYRVVGVFGDYRIADRAWPSASDATFHVFTPRQPPSPRPPLPAGDVDSGGFFQFFEVVVRLDSRASAASVLAAARSVLPRVSMDLDFVDDAYADRHAETLLAMRVVGLFGIGAFLMAMAGLYGVMAFLVAGRTREIGIRMALGADRARIGRFVMGSSLRLVVAGAAIGIAAAILVSRAIASQLFGVTPTDPATYVTVAIVTVVTAALATWQPARRAARVDPVQTLRAE